MAGTVSHQLHECSVCCEKYSLYRTYGNKYRGRTLPSVAERLRDRRCPRCYYEDYRRDKCVVCDKTVPIKTNHVSCDACEPITHSYRTPEELSQLLSRDDVRSDRCVRIRVEYTIYPGMDPYADDFGDDDDDTDGSVYNDTDEEYICLPNRVPLTEAGVREYVRRCKFKFSLVNKDPHPHEALFEGLLVGTPEIVEVPSSPP